uniref:Uncharacterized protein n=1 Tax=Rhizophora mucronata TaxID=61149 RepID=A0A2P2LKH2_RHIMU
MGLYGLLLCAYWSFFFVFTSSYLPCD